MCEMPTVFSAWRQQILAFCIVHSLCTVASFSFYGTANYSQAFTSRFPLGAFAPRNIWHSIFMHKNDSPGNPGAPPALQKPVY